MPTNDVTSPFPTLIGEASVWGGRQFPGWFRKMTGLDPVAVLLAICRIESDCGADIGPREEPHIKRLVERNAPDCANRWGPIAWKSWGPWQVLGIVAWESGLRCEAPQAEILLQYPISNVRFAVLQLENHGAFRAIFSYCAKNPHEDSEALMKTRAKSLEIIGRTYNGGNPGAENAAVNRYVAKLKSEIGNRVAISTNIEEPTT